MHLNLQLVSVVLLLLLLGHPGHSAIHQYGQHTPSGHASSQAVPVGPGHTTADGPVQLVVTPAAADAQPDSLALGRQPAAVLPTLESLSTPHHTRGLSAATQGRTAPASLAAPPRSPAAVGDRCPGATAELSTAGCTCTVYRSNSAQDSSSDSTRRVNVCPAGFRCSPSAKEAVLSGIMAGWSLNSSSSSKVTRMGGAVTEQGICVPCQLGEYCPVGTQEETLLSISACGAQSLSISNQTSNSTGSSGSNGSRASLASDTCSGVKLCPGGSFCPSADQQMPCDPGHWCPAGSIKSQPCNITRMLVWNPFAKAPGSSQLILETLVKSAQPLDGNSCPINATNPLNGCPPGFFCPTAAEKKPCPRGYFCPGYTSAPVSCPMLGSCALEEDTTPDWSWLGVALMLGLLAALLLLLEYARVSGRSNRSAQSLEDDVMHLVEAVGFKMVGSHGSYHVARAARPAGEQHSLHMRFSRKASTTSSGHFLQSRTSVFARVLRSASGYHHKHAAGPLPHNGMAPGSSNQVPDDAVLDVGVLAGEQKPAAGVNGDLQQAKSNDRTQLANAGSVLTTQASMQSPFEVSALVKAPSHSDTALPVIAPKEAASADDSNEEYVINPRLTLVFRDVWVADIPIEEGLARKAKRRLVGLCRKDSSTRDDHSSAHGAQAGRSSTSGSSSSSSSAQRETVAKLEAAAAEGAFFIVPGNSGRFTHSQLHAIMGPSGCGKTTLCKALAGRVPLNRMCGDVRLLCSTAEDNFQSEVELPATGSIRGAGAVRNISQMTGFVPQFDQLHESLTVLENLLLAARLRLPVTGKGQGFSASAVRHLRRQRHREVHKVVGEVMALMALNKVATTVVGTSSDRTLSGGQRKRVAIAIELVSKPSLLWLDEPTSGLDAAVAYDVLAALKASSERGMNVLAVMHQPRCSIFNMFDSCLLLGSDGNVVYSGPQRLAQSYMAFLGFYIPPNENLADFLLDVTSGVVPRPGDPDYMPSHLAAIWHKAGNIWVDNQLRKMQQLHSTTSEDLVGLLPVPPAVDSPVDWPWRPRDLEALLARFDLLIDSEADAQVFGRERFARKHRERDGPSVLTYDGFIGFWDESGIEDLLGEEYGDFLAGLCDDFELKPGGTITRARFVEVLKAQLRAAAAAAEGVSAGQSGGLSTATAGSDADSPFAQGVLTGPQARLRQHTMMKQQTLQRQLSKRPDSSAGNVLAGASGRAALGQPQMQALSRWKKAQQAASTAAVLNARLQQLKNAPQSTASLQPCASIQEARARGLEQLADYLVMEASQVPDQLEARNGRISASSSAADSLPQQIPTGGTSLLPALTRVATLLEVDTLSPEDTNPGSTVAAKSAAAASGKDVTAAAAAAVSSRKLPSLPTQLELIMLRCSWKAVLCRSALMTDLVLTSLLGLALGIAQGRNIQPGSSLTWMLITLLAYGCISLVRSTRSYGNERHLYLQQESPAGVSVTAWVFGHQMFDMVGLMLHPLLFFAWIYVLTLTPVPAWSYFTTLVVVGFYTSGLGYLVSLSVNHHTAMIAGLAVALLLGGVANGVLPSMWQLASSHPLFWLDQLSYTRWGLQALYISWLIPAPAVQAPATATFLSGLGFCGLDPGLLQALKGRNSGWDAAGSSGIALNSTAVGSQQLWNMTSAQRSTALAQAAAANLRDSPAASKPDAAAAAAITQLWQYYNHPHLLNQQCNAARGTAVAVLVALGVVCRLSVWVLVKVKVARKAQQ